MNISRVRRCVLYARLSVTKEESVSIARQLEAGRRYAEARGWEVVGEYIDDGVSATVNSPEDRKGWAALVAADGFDAVVIWKVDRLARRVLDFLHADDTLQKRGAGLVAVEDPIDMTSPQGRAFAVMLAVFGEMEAEGIRARVRAARAHLIKDGRFVGGGIPYGYRSTANPDGPGRMLVKDPERIRWLGEAVRLAQRGETVNAVATWLTDRGAPLPIRRKPRLDPGNVAWNRQTVEQLLRNPILAGMTPHNPGRARSDKRADPFAVVRDPHGVPVIDESLAIITFDEFTQVQRILDARDSPQSRKRPERDTTSPFLSRVALCDDCDVFMYRGTNQKKPVLYCPKCRQTLSRVPLDPHLTNRLLAERGDEPCAGSTVQDRWDAAGTDELARREILRTQLESLRIRRGVVGRYFDAERVLLRWRPGTVPAGAHGAARAKPAPTPTAG
ncbi:DNA invertase Pin-like site-specific DNA recombinase [Promicromonospora sp. AC04]|uniref:recombinase family protein n=1 Tax=Promicromonospora sp. AC04 TaxID=2135723 RepID=UPI000D3C0249|nr:recombinase family protein [Promicromonospora sp. AC04]PUB21459.1 DNA invertase Pin-like site-specific DNA recombinase [Promicromonospora sp. AC04]